MNKRVFAGLFALTAVSLPVLTAHAQAPFEGTVVWSMTMPQLDEDKHEMQVNIKGDKTEMEMDLGVQGKVRMFRDASLKKSYILMEAQHMGVELPDPSDDPNDKSESVDLKPTGKKATVAGHAAEEYLVSSDKGQVSLWVTNDIPKEIRDGVRKIMAANGRGKKQNEAFRKLSDKGLFPVKMEVKDAGETQMSMELVKLDTKKLDDAIFVKPADITFRPLPTGMGGGQD